MVSDLIFGMLQGVLGLILGVALTCFYICLSKPEQKQVQTPDLPENLTKYVLKLRGQGFTAEECSYGCIVTKIRVRSAVHEESGTPFERGFHPGDVLIPFDPSSSSRYLLLEVQEKGFRKSSMVVDSEVIQEGLQTGWLLRLGHLSVLTRILSQLQATDARPLVAHSSVDLSYSEDCELLVQALLFLNLGFSKRYKRPSQEARSQYDRLLDEDLV